MVRLSPESRVLLRDHGVAMPSPDELAELLPLLRHAAEASDPAATIGRCQARGCARLFVDQSRNRSRRFCGNTCASRTTVAAYRARQRPRTPGA